MNPPPASQETVPENFYFNGELMPQYGSWWAAVKDAFFQRDRDRDWDEEVSHRDVYIVDCKIDHVGVVESENPAVFLYVVQEMLIGLLENRAKVEDCMRQRFSQGTFSEEVQKDIYNGVVEAALRMRELTKQCGYAFWTNGEEADRLQLLEAIRCSRLPPDDPDYKMPPHVRHRSWEINFKWECQIEALHRLAASGGLSEPLRTRLLNLKMPGTKQRLRYLSRA